jgi:hypothetical protein
VRRPLVLGLLLSTLPTAMVLTVARPAEAVDPVYDQASMTALLAGVRTDGVVGASGGLVTVDTGSAYISAALDSSPSSQVRAAPGEPGTLFRTAVGQANGAAGQTVLTTPDAEARFPGNETSKSYAAAPPTSVSPVSLGTAAATAKVSATTAYGFAQAASFDVAPVLSVGPSTSTVTMKNDLTAGTASNAASTSVSKVTVAGVLSIESIVATAAVSADHDTHKAAQTLDVSGAVVGGQPVGITNEGVEAVGTPILPATTLSQATDMANAQLAAAGIELHTLGGVAKHDTRSAEADSGGVQITLKTVDLPLGVAGNTLVVDLGGVAVTELDGLAQPPAVVPVETQGPTGGTTSGGEPSRTVTTTIPGTQGIPGSIAPPPGETAPQVAPPTEQAAFVIRGRRISASTALIAFAGWQLVSLATATLYAFVERRRRLAQLGRTP